MGVGLQQTTLRMHQLWRATMSSDNTVYDNVKYVVKYGDCTSFTDNNEAVFSTQEEALAFRRGLLIGDSYSYESLAIEEIEEVQD